MHDTLEGEGGGGARRENDPEPCQTKPNSDRNHSPPTDAAPNGIQFCAESSGKGQWQSKSGPIQKKNLNRAPYVNGYTKKKIIK